MTNVTSAVIGAIFLGLAILGFLYPVTSEGYTVFQVNDFCNSGIGQVAQFLENISGVNQIEQKCLEYRYATYGIIGIGIIGIVLVIVGSVIPSKSKENTLTCSYCNYIPSSETDLLKHNANNHLNESPYTCEHCDFIGITEEILWNHYNDKHPDKKKW